MSSVAVNHQLLAAKAAWRSRTVPGVSVHFGRVNIVSYGSSTILCAPRRSRQVERRLIPIGKDAAQQHQLFCPDHCIDRHRRHQILRRIFLQNRPADKSNSILSH